MRILYVEDNPANLSLMQRIARMGGHEVIAYTEGEIALNRYAQDKPDLILLDVQLAGKLNGVDVVKKLREMGVTKPVIAVTAYAMVGDRERFLESGFDGYLSKPLPVTELVELVQKYELQLKPAAASATTVLTTQEAPPISPTETATTSASALPPTDAATTQADRSKALGGDIDLAALAAKTAKTDDK